MLKSRGRTGEIPVMGIEEWPQVDSNKLKSISRIRNSNMVKKDRSRKGGCLMPEVKNTKLCVDDLRHNEYYEMQEVFDELYAKAQKGEVFTDLMPIILKRENILLAYRNIKTNTGSNTAGTDNLTIKDIGKLSPENVVDKVRYILTGSKHGYRPRAVRRVEIPKPNGDMRPLGIPCIWDRLIQQCIKQVIEPICEAKFSEHSYGFRPNRSVEHAIAETYQRLQLSKLHFVVEFDIKGFFDNVNHQKLLHQIYDMGIQDETLKSKIKRILKAPIKMPDGELTYPKKGTPQGGIISPLLANIVLNELDQWVENNWENNPIVYKYPTKRKNGRTDKSRGYNAMRKTKLKEMYIVRYADDFRIFCRTKTDAERVKFAVTQKLQERLKLEISEEKTKVVNVKKKYSEFLGFKIRVHGKGQKQVVQSHISDKQLKKERQALIEQGKRIAKPAPIRREYWEIRLYNMKVMGIQNYYQIATEINRDCNRLGQAVIVVLTNRLKKGNRLVRTGRQLTKTEKKRYGKSKMLRYVVGTNEPIYPIGYIQCKNPMNKKRAICSYTVEGRAEIHDNLKINTKLMIQLMKQPLYGKSCEYADNRIALFSAQSGKCAVTGREFTSTNEIHCHHKVPKHKGGTDDYDNLVLICDYIHILIHVNTKEAVEKYKTICNLNKEQMKKLNNLRKLAGYAEIA